MVRRKWIGPKSAESPQRGFTLVELLVVIGIIAVLVGILLPTLQGARRHALTVKCLSNLRQLGICVRMYAEEFKGAAVPVRCGGPGTTAGILRYNLWNASYGVASPSKPNETKDAAWWMNFLAHYISSTKNGGSADTTFAATADAKNMPWWCPAWYGSVNRPAYHASDVDLQNTGYSVNYMPTFTARNPLSAAAAPSAPNAPLDWDYKSPHNEDGWLRIEFDPGVPPNNATTAAKITKGQWWKLIKYAPASERCLMADTYMYFLEAVYKPLPGVFVGEHNGIDTSTYSPDPTSQTTVDWYRHGVYPSLGGNQAFKSVGGKVAYNIMYADGHCVTVTYRAEAYRSIRMRYPG